MKKLTLLNVILLLILAFSSSCQEDENKTPTNPLNDNFDPAQATLLKQGTLMGIGHTVSGTVKIYDSAGKKVVVLDPYSSQNGPDLKVYLSTDESASSYINLGPLKSTTGKQSYEVPGTPDVSTYQYVHIWCEQFSVVFGRAQVQ